MERHKRWSLVFVLLSLLGLAAWLLGRGDDQRAADDAARAVEVSKTPPDRARRASERPELERAAKAAIAGSVRDRDRNPIAGAQVCAWPSLGDLEGHPPGRPRCTKSDADGHYRLDELLPVRMLVNAEARGYMPQRWFALQETHREPLLQLRAGQTLDNIDFALRRGGVPVEGVVRDISGGVIEGAFVWLETNGFGDAGRSATLSDAEGRFSLWTAPQRIKVNAEADGYASGFRVWIAPGSSLEVVLTPESVISGRVLLAGTDEPVSGVIVEAQGERRLGGTHQARSDEDGKFRIDKLQPGIYSLGARGDELYGEAVELVHLGLAETAEDLTVELHPAFLVTGQVLVAGGSEPRPCPSGSVELHDRNDKLNYRSGRVHEDGEVEIRTVLPGSYQVEVHCAGMVAESNYPDLEITNASLTGQIWELREGLAIRGVVVDQQGSPVEGARVRAGMKPNPDDPRAQTTNSISQPTLDDGTFIASGLLPGTYEVRLFSMGDGEDGEPVTVELQPGADVNDVRLIKPGGGTLTGIVRDAEGRGVPALVLRATSLERQAATAGISDDSGRFVIDKVPPGEVRIVAADTEGPLRAPGTRDDDEQGTLAHVQAGETTEVELVVESRKAMIRGRVVDEHGSPVADAFIRHQRLSDSAAAAPDRGKLSLHRTFEDRPVLSESDGSFVIENLAEDATYVLGAFRKGGGEAIQTGVRPGETVELTIVETGEIAGKVVTASDNTAPERFKVTLNDEREGLTRTDVLFRSGGAFRMKELPPGTYTLIVDSSAGSARVEGIELAPGEHQTDLLITLTARVTVRGRLIDIDTREPVPGMSVAITARGTTMTFAGDETGELPHVSGEDGRFEVANALTGKVTLSVLPRALQKDARYTWLMMLYPIPDGEAVVDVGDIELVANRVGSDQKPGDIGFEVQQAPLDAAPESYVATVALIRPGGPADGSGLVIGDQIESVDRHDVRGINSYRFGLLTKVAPGQSLELGLARGKTVTITAGPPPG